MNTARLLVASKNNVSRIVFKTQTSVLSCRRTFISTPRIQAAEDPNAFISSFRNTTLFKRFADKPEALQALEAFAKVLQSKGKSRVLNV